MNQDLATVWSGIRDELRGTLDQGAFDIWIAPLAAMELAGEPLVLTLAAPSAIQQWVADRFGAAITRAAQVVLGPHAVATVISHGDAVARAGAATGPLPPAASAAADAARRPEPQLDLNPRLTFGQFVIGDANRFAHAAALAVAELPAQAYNPLFFYGPPGTGKTHLLHAIGDYVRRYGGGLSVRYTTAEQFTDDFLGALRQGPRAIDTFKDRHRGVDVLLIDDVQFLEAKARTEQEFFHTFNALYDTGSQLVLTSDRLPADLAALEDRLRERFACGLVADLGSPDRPTRLAVLRKRVDHDGIELEDESALEVIADRITGNLRALDGALIRVIAFASLSGRPLDAALAEEVLAGLYPGGAPQPGSARPLPGAGAPLRRREPVSVPQVVDVTCAAFGVTREAIVGTGRTADIAWARQVAMYLSREHTGQTLPAIGRQFGGRAHTTVLHAVRRATARLAADPEARAVVDTLTQQLAERSGGR